MSERTHVQEVFTEVEPDPDAILDAAGADSPTEFIAGEGRHDSPENSDDAEERVTALLENLLDAAIETTGTSVEDETGDSHQAATRPTTTVEDDDSPTATETDSEARLSELVTFGEPSVNVLPGDRAVIDDVIDHEPQSSDRSAERKLVGSPTVTRVSSDAFGSC